MRIRIAVAAFAAAAAASAAAASTVAHLPVEPRDALSHAKQSYDAILAKMTEQSEVSQCFRAVYDALVRDGCASLDRAGRDRVAYHMMRCQFIHGGRAEEIAPCPLPHQVDGRGGCLSRLSEAAFAAYTQYSTHAENLCFYMESRDWQASTRGLVDSLASGARETVATLDRVRAANEAALQQTQQALEHHAALADNFSAVQGELVQTQRLMQQGLADTWTRFQLVADALAQLTELYSRGTELQKRYLYDNIMMAETAAVYGLGLSVGWLATATERTQAARTWVVLTLVAGGALELYLRNHAGFMSAWLLEAHATQRAAVGALHDHAAATAPGLPALNGTQPGAGAAPEPWWQWLLGPLVDEPWSLPPELAHGWSGTAAAPPVAGNSGTANATPADSAAFQLLNDTLDADARGMAAGPTVAGAMLLWSRWAAAAAAACGKRLTSLTLAVLRQLAFIIASGIWVIIRSAVGMTAAALSGVCTAAVDGLRAQLLHQHADHEHWEALLLRVVRNVVASMVAALVLHAAFTYVDYARENHAMLRAMMKRSASMRPGPSADADSPVESRLQQQEMNGTSSARADSLALVVPEVLVPAMSDTDTPLPAPVPAAHRLATLLRRVWGCLRAAAAVRSPLPTLPVVQAVMSDAASQSAGGRFSYAFDAANPAGFDVDDAADSDYDPTETDAAAGEVPALLASFDQPACPPLPSRPPRSHPVAPIAASGALPLTAAVSANPAAGTGLWAAALGPDHGDAALAQPRQYDLRPRHGYGLQHSAATDVESPDDFALFMQLRWAASALQRHAAVTAAPDAATSGLHAAAGDADADDDDDDAVVDEEDATIWTDSDASSDSGSSMSGSSHNGGDTHSDDGDGLGGDAAVPLEAAAAAPAVGAPSGAAVSGVKRRRASGSAAGVGSGGASGAGAGRARQQRTAEAAQGAAVDDASGPPAAKRRRHA